jgi:hypothetical protein
VRLNHTRSFVFGLVDLPPPPNSTVVSICLKYIRRHYGHQPSSAFESSSMAKQLVASSQCPCLRSSTHNFFENNLGVVFSMVKPSFET